MGSGPGLMRDYWPACRVQVTLDGFYAGLVRIAGSERPGLSEVKVERPEREARGRTTLMPRRPRR